MCLGVLPTLSYAFLPSVLGFTVGFAVLQRNTIAYRWYFAGGMLCVAGVFGCWLFLFGDIQGYFYQHFLYNQPFYTKSYGVSGYDFIKNIFIFDGVSLKNVLVYAERLVACAIWLVLACLPFRMCTWVRILLLVSLLLLNPLGVVGFHHNVLLLVEILLLGFWLIQAENKAWGRFNIAAVMALVLVVLVLGFRVPSSPHGFKRKAYFTHLASLDDNKNTGLYRFIKKMVPADETILALEYAPAVYLFANRSSSIKSFFYLPHQALYDKAVPERYRIHLCETILNKKPLLLWYTETPAKMDALIKQYPLVVYEPCFGAILEKYYFRWSRFSPLYMRREYAKRLGLGVGEGLNDHLRAVSVVDIQQPLVFYGEGVQDRIKSIGIRLATFQKKVRASAVLLLYGLDMTVKSLPVDIVLSADQDNDYYWVDLPLDGRGYTRAIFQQFHIDEGQLSVWQSGQDTRWKNCIMVEFMDGRQHLTSGCPIL
jgi:hypothetical protein